MRLLDVSHHQPPAKVDYARAKELGFVGVIARATYGVRPDETFDDHVRSARAAGLIVGGYHFFRQQQDPGAQARAFADTVAAVNYGPGDILPALDLEANGAYDGEPIPAQYERAKRIYVDWHRRFGGAMVYFSPAFWTAMGRPQWWVDGPIWIAHYHVATPSVPLGRPWAIWQNKVERLPGVYELGPIDQNEVASELPLIEEKLPSYDDIVRGWIPLTRDVEAERRDRDRSIREADGEE